MGVFQYIYIAIVILGLMISSYQHDKPKEGKHNVWHSIIATSISLCILYFGGFFN